MLKEEPNKPSGSSARRKARQKIVDRHTEVMAVLKQGAVEESNSTLLENEESEMMAQ